MSACNYQQKILMVQKYILISVQICFAQMRFVFFFCCKDYYYFFLISAQII